MGNEQETQQNNVEQSRDSIKTARSRQTFGFLYRKFRRSGLTRLDSAFNALYICQSNKMYNRKLDVEDVGEGFYSHPAGWYKNGCEKVRRASTTKTLRALDFVAKVIAPFTKSTGVADDRIDFFSDSSTDTLKRAIFSFKKAIPIVSVAVAVSVLFLSIYIDSEKSTVIEVSLDGEYAFEVSSASVVEDALDRVSTKISSITGETYSFPHELSFEAKRKRDASCIDATAVSEILYSYTEGSVTEAYGLYVDSELVAVLRSRSEITSVLEEVRLEHMKETGKEEDIANKIEIKYQEYSAKDIIDKETLILMLTPKKEEKDETPAHRALLSSGSDRTTLTIDADASAIEGKIAEALASSEGKEGVIELDFAVYYEKTVRESVPYMVKYERDDTLYETQEIVETNGRNGLANNTYKIKYVDGVEESRELVNQTFIRLPRESVVRVGTKKLPERMTEEENGGRYMINPVPSAYISDHFGWRVLRGRRDLHEGLDLAAWLGNSIYAAASGEVIFSGYNSTYGYLVKILHDDGLVTVYAHCSKLLVSLGDLVTQGEEIALVGSTGYSFGYHCHFEVISDGEKVDPENFIYSMD